MADTAPRTPPHSDEAEAGFLGSVICDGTILRSAGLTADMLYRPRHRVFMEAMLALDEERIPIDEVTLTDKLTSMGRLEQVGGIQMIAALASTAVVPMMASQYAGIIEQHAANRAVLQQAQVLVEGILDPTLGVDLEEQKGIVRAAIDQQAGTYDSKQAKGDRFRESYQRGQLPYLRTHLSRLNEVVGGLPLGGVTIVAGRPSAGKTAAALSFALGMAGGFTTGEKGNDGPEVPVLLQSTESTHDQLYSRLISQMSLWRGRWNNSQIPLREIITREAPIEDVDTWSRWLDAYPLHICRDTVTRQRMVAQARQYVHRHGVRCVIVDYLNRIVDMTQRGQERRRRTIEASCHDYSELAKELGVAVVLLCQLNRDAEGVLEPTLVHLKEAGEIEEDADVVLMYARKTRFERWGKTMVRKNRDGPADGGFRFKFEPEFVFVSDYEGSEET